MALYSLKIGGKWYTAEGIDLKGALQAVDLRAPIYAAVQRVPAGGDYVGQALAQAVTDKLGTTSQIAKLHELHTSAGIPGAGS